jgi:hypothetical protein
VQLAIISAEETENGAYKTRGKKGLRRERNRRLRSLGAATERDQSSETEYPRRNTLHVMPAQGFEFAIDAGRLHRPLAAAVLSKVGKVADR